MITELDIMQRIPSIFHTNGMVQRAMNLLQTYDELETASDSFTDRFSLTCPAACGTCCEHFTPAISGEEALLLALYLLYEKRDQRLFDALYRPDKGEACPLYDPEDPHHCQVYPVRPFVCRSFNSLPSRDKNGMFKFRSCRFTAEGYEKRVLNHEEIVSEFPLMRSMSDFGSQAVVENASGDASSLPEMVIQVIARLLLIEKYAEDEISAPVNPEGPQSSPDDDDVPPIAV